MSRTLVVFFLPLIGLMGAGCSNNGCDDALTQTKSATDQVCKEDGFAQSGFCTTCVERGYYSTTGPMDCECTLLSFDQPFCTYPSDSDAKAQVRGAIQWANQNCAEFHLPTVDGGSGSDAALDAGADGTS